MKTIKIIIVILSVLFALLFSGVFNYFIYTVSDGNEAIVTMFGEIVGEPKKSGIHFKFPLIEEIHIINKIAIRAIEHPLPNYKNAKIIILWEIVDSKQFFISSQKHTDDFEDYIEQKLLSTFNQVAADTNLRLTSKYSQKKGKHLASVKKKIKTIKGNLQSVIRKYGINIVALDIQQEKILTSK